MNYTDYYLEHLMVIRNVIPNLEQLKNTSIFITGASGLIGSALVDFLLQLNESQGFGIQIYLGARSEERIKMRFGERAERKEFHYIPYDAQEPLNINNNFDYFIHGASNANPGVYVQEPVETMLSNFVGLHYILEYAREFGMKRALYISSSEVYGKKKNNFAYKEDDYQFVDILNARACYPSAKRAAETLCVAYWQEYGLDSVIVRPGHIYGPTMTATDTRAASQFARDVSANQNIVMKSAGTQLRSYCYVIDCVSAILTVLLNGKTGNAYNISNAESIVSIRQMAECFAECSGKQVIFETPTGIEKAGYNLMENSSLDASKLEQLGWAALFKLKDGVEATLKIMR